MSVGFVSSPSEAAYAMMPRLDGFGLLKALRADSRTRDIPMVMLSARAGEEARLEGLQSGAVDYLIKPFSARELLARVSARLEINRVNRAAIEHERELRKQCEEALRASEERFRRYFELGLIGMARTSPDKGILEVNDELCRILGYERNELLQKTWPELTHPDDLPADVAQFNRVMAGEMDGYSLDKRWIRKDGEVIPSIMAAKCLRRAGGSVDYFVGLVLDTTERKRADEELRRSEAYLAEGQRISHTGSWAVKLPSKEVFWSQEMFRIYGIDPVTTKLSQQMAFQLIHADDRVFVQEAFERGVREKSDFDVEHRAIVADGSIRHLHALGRPVLNQSGEVTEFVGTVADITERKQAEESLRKTHESVEMVLESITEMFFTVDKEWRYTHFNKHAEEQLKMLGKNPASVLGKTLWDEFPSPPTEEALRRAMAERVAVTIEHYYAPLGEWVENRIYPSPDGGLTMFVRYVTERRRAEEALQKLQTELAHMTRMMSMGELVASIAHEINQPLGAIVNNSNVARRLVGTQGAEEEMHAILSDIVHDANRSSAIIARIRALANKSVPEKTSLQLKEVVADVLALAERELADGRITVRTELPEDLPRVSGDRIQLQQVLLNLVMNGLDAMSAVADSRRTLTIGGLRDKLNGQPAVLITVHDLGTGFKAEDGERLFEAFYTTKPDGLGMGLSISRSIVEAHGGRLWAQLNRDMGAKFLLSLPAEIPETL